MSEWSRFEFSLKKPLSIHVDELTEVHHIVHLRTSRRILEDQQLRAGLIHDESKLNRTRLCVTWLSANYWHNGSIYGTVRITFDWKKIIDDRSLYWVEAMDYGNAAYRLLVTDRDLTNDRRVTVFDPSCERGPVRLRNNRWCWNREYTSEFMLESDLDLSEAKSLSFVEHAKCRESRSCAEEKTGWNVAAAQTLAFLLGNNIHCVDHLLRNADSLNSSAESFVNYLWSALGRNRDRFSGALRKVKSAEDVLLGALALYGSGQHAAALDVVKTIADQDTFTEALSSIIRMHFELSTWEMPQ